MPFSALPLEVILENIARQDGKERENKYRKAELEIPHFCRWYERANRECKINQMYTIDVKLEKAMKNGAMPNTETKENTWEFMYLGEEDI